jgi:hypothetical protein
MKKQKTFLAHGADAGLSAATSAPARAYNFGARIPDFVQGQSCDLRIESSDDGFIWTPVVDIHLDEASELIVPNVYVENSNLRVAVIAMAGRGLTYSVWMSEENK